MVAFSEMENHGESLGFLGEKIRSSVSDMWNLRTFETSKRLCHVSRWKHGSEDWKYCLTWKYKFESQEMVTEFMFVEEIAWEESVDCKEVTRELGRKSGQCCFM